jgi:hypothetical protein
LAAGCEQQRLATTLLDDQGFATEALELAVQGIELLLDTGLLPAEPLGSTKG